MFKVANGDGTVVEHSPHQSKVEGSSPGDRKTKWQKDRFLVTFFSSPGSETGEHLNLFSANLWNTLKETSHELNHNRQIVSK